MKRSNDLDASKGILLGIFLGVIMWALLLLGFASFVSWVAAW